MASSQEKAKTGVLRNAAALLDEMQLMGETQGECFRLSVRFCCLLMHNCAQICCNFWHDASSVRSFFRCQEGDQLGALARLCRAACVLAAAGEPRVLLPSGAQ